ncbi:MAG TPA: hypothetical protein VKZ60_04190 [Chloroflexota bacterium]|jgi:hypothetical protein|nr:hypothetical protein [Chloroflexota bacterium]
MRGTVLRVLGMGAALVAVAGRFPTAAAAGPPAQLDDAVVVMLTSPQPGAHLQGRVVIAGYAFDRRSPAGSGLNENDIQVHLDDQDAPSQLLGIALGGQRSAEAAAYGDQYGQTGFALGWQTCTFAPGPHRLTVWVSSLVAPGARNMASVEVYLDSCAEGLVAYRDDFDDRPDAVDTVRATASAAAVSTRPPNLVFGDFAAGIDARCAADTPDCTPVLAFRSTETLQSFAGLTFAASPSRGTFALGLKSGAAQPMELLIPPTPTTALRASGEWNRLAVIAQGDWLRLYLNGEQVAELHEPRVLWGKLGWGVAGGAAEFAHLIVETPGPPYALTALSGPPAAPPLGAEALRTATQGPVLFRDDFTDPGSGWQVVLGEGGYTNGTYRLVAPGSGGAAGAVLPQRYGDFYAEVTAGLPTASPGASLIFGFRMAPEATAGYTLIVLPAQRLFGVSRVSGGQATVLYDAAYSAAIAPGAPNRLGIWARGADLVVVLNGQPVAQLRDETFAEGALALGVGAGASAAPVEARFTDLVVRELPTSP